MPDEVLLPTTTPDLEVLREVLREQKGRKVAVIRPQRGQKKRLVELANRNAGEAENIATSQEQKRRREMDSLQQLLDLKSLPRNIECFDISNLGARQAVGSMVVFRDCEPDKNSYRRYRIREVEGQDDFGMMSEVIRRRYRHVVEQSGEDWQREFPDLVVVDGGKGQLSAALSALADLGAGRPDVVALAKARSRGGRQVAAERVFVPGDDRAVELPEHSYGYRLITRVRDEAHRFAIAYHRKLRRKESMKSPLTEVSGIGEKLAGRVMDQFKTLGRLEGADIDELAEVPGLSERLARKIKNYLAGNQAKSHSGSSE